ncbi:MAG: hypothetical protein U9N60_02545 [Thermodesulfobacteriota bacterium]|nr:hypothetical protein [Thermodesulfobacteriota bacterium]
MRVSTRLRIFGCVSGRSKSISKPAITLAGCWWIDILLLVHLGKDYILGAVGVLQFDVTMARLKAEYGVDAVYEPVNFNVARWVRCDDHRKKMAEFEKKYIANMAMDAEGCLSFLTTSEWQLSYYIEKWPEIEFFKTREVN